MHKQIHALPSVTERIDLSDVPWEWPELFSEHPLAAKTFCEAALSQAVLGPLNKLLKHLQQLLHVGPLRVIPDSGMQGVKASTIAAGMMVRVPGTLFLTNLAVSAIP